MTKWQGNIIIMALLAAIFLLMLLVYNVFNGLAVLNYKVDKTQALIEKSMTPSKAPPLPQTQK